MALFGPTCSLAGKSSQKCFGFGVISYRGRALGATFHFTLTSDFGQSSLICRFLWCVSAIDDLFETLRTSPGKMALRS